VDHPVGAPPRYIALTAEIADARRLGLWPADRAHTFPLAHMEEAYDVFARAADTGALKVVLGEEPHEEVVPYRAA
ncbi:hypothetical protein ABT116_36185, partial [Streptomyces sp. NPDC002130]